MSSKRRVKRKHSRRKHPIRKVTKLTHVVVETTPPCGFIQIGQDAFHLVTSFMDTKSVTNLTRVSKAMNSLIVLHSTMLPNSDLSRVVHEQFKYIPLQTASVEILEVRPRKTEFVLHLLIKYVRLHCRLKHCQSIITGRLLTENVSGVIDDSQPSGTCYIYRNKYNHAMTRIEKTFCSTKCLGIHALADRHLPGAELDEARFIQTLDNIYRVQCVICKTTPHVLGAAVDPPCCVPCLHSYSPKSETYLLKLFGDPLDESPVYYNPGNDAHNLIN